ncbi:MAG: hypothetical protein HY720_16960 [Planctomycetes bacterium]|nr:hypothetical protein [Planctomycetota bacterium]
MQPGPALPGFPPQPAPRPPRARGTLLAGVVLGFVSAAYLLPCGGCLLCSSLIPPSEEPVPAFFKDARYQRAIEASIEAQKKPAYRYGTAAMKALETLGAALFVYASFQTLRLARHGRVVLLLAISLLALGIAGETALAATVVGPEISRRMPSEEMTPGAFIFGSACFGCGLLFLPFLSALFVFLPSSSAQFAARDPVFPGFPPVP